MAGALPGTGKGVGDSEYDDRRGEYAGKKTLGVSAEGTINQMKPWSTPRIKFSVPIPMNDYWRQYGWKNTCMVK